MLKHKLFTNDINEIYEVTTIVYHLNMTPIARPSKAVDNPDMAELYDPPLRGTLPSRHVTLN